MQGRDSVLIYIGWSRVIHVALSKKEAIFYNLNWSDLARQGQFCLGVTIFVHGGPVLHTSMVLPD